MKTAAVLIGDVRSRGLGICPLPSSTPRSIWQLKCPHPREFAIREKKNANARGLARGGHGCSWNWLMHNITRLKNILRYTGVFVALTCDQALFSFRSVKHSGGKGETKNRAWYNSSTERLPSDWLTFNKANQNFFCLHDPRYANFPKTAIRKKSRKCRQNKKIIGYDISYIFLCHYCYYLHKTTSSLTSSWR